MKIIKNEEGMTIIELLTSFSLSLVVMIFLFNIVLLLRDTYNKNSIKSMLALEQSLLSTELNSDFVEEQVTRVEKCLASDFCYNITIETETETRVKTLNVNTTTNTISYGTSYNYTLSNTESFGTLKICRFENNISNNMNSYLVIDIPIVSTVFDESFGVKIIYPYNKNNPDINYVTISFCP